MRTQWLSYPRCVDVPLACSTSVFRSFCLNVAGDLGNVDPLNLNQTIDRIGLA